MKKRLQERWVAVSGGFDPLHAGHVRLFEAAKKLGDKLVVIVNNDHWLRAKKGYVFMSQKERMELISALRCVDRVVLTDHKERDADMSVARSLEKIRPDIFANGGDRVQKNTPEVAVCKKHGIRMAFNVGEGGKIQSSSWMIKNASRPVKRTERPWGEFYGWDGGSGWYLKTIYIKPGKRLSWQYHNHRGEYWMLVEGDATATLQKKGEQEKKIVLKKGEVVYADVKDLHRLESKKGGVLVEVAMGAFDEEDIIRLQDDHGRTKTK